MVHKDHSKMRTTDLALELMSLVRAPSEPLLERTYTKNLALLVSRYCVQKLFCSYYY